MTQRASAPARAIAALALVCGFLVVLVVVIASLAGGSGRSDRGTAGRPAHHAAAPHTPRSYVVQSGDTLSSIAHRTGVPVVRIQALNPGIDPQILISGEKLKLR